MSEYPRDVYCIILDYLSCIEVAFLTLHQHTLTPSYLCDKFSSEFVQDDKVNWNRRYSENTDAILTCAIMSGVVNTFHPTTIISYRNTDISLKLSNNHVSELNFILFMELHPTWDLHQHIISLAERHMHLALNYVICRGINLDLDIMPLVIAPLIFAHSLPDDPTFVFNLVQWFLQREDVNVILNMSCHSTREQYTIAEVLIMRYPHFVLTYLRDEAYILTRSSFDAAVGMLYCRDLELFQGYVNIVIALYERNPTLTSPIALGCIRHLIKYNHPYIDALKQLLRTLEHS